MMVARASAELKLKVSACAAGAARNKAEAVRTAAARRDLIAESFIILRWILFLLSVPERGTGIYSPRRLRSSTRRAKFGSRREMGADVAIQWLIGSAG